MDIKTTIKESTLCVSLSGELDECSADFTRTYLDRAFEDNLYKDVLLDFNKLEFMDSTGIGVLLGRYKKLKSKSKNIYITNANPTVEKIIKMSGIYEIMPKIS